MISVKYIWDRLAAFAAKYQSGTDNVAYFNSALTEVQLEIFSDFSPIYDESEKVKGLLDFWVKPQSGTSNPDGSVGIGSPSEIVMRPLAVGYTASPSQILFGIPAISESELMSVARIPQRAPNVAKKNVYYRFNSPSTANFYPQQTTPYSLFYLIYPSPANIAFTFSQTANEDIMTYDPANSTDLAWPQAATNLILYKMLEKYGVNIRENLLMEYAKYGITQTAQAGEVPKGGAN